MGNLFQEWKLTLRKFRRSLGSSLATIAVLAIAAGANAAIYTLADNYFVGNASSRDDDVYLVGASPRDGRDYFYMFHHQLTEPVEESLTSFQSLARASFYSLTLSGIDRPLRLDGLRLGPGSQEVLQIEVIRGRAFRPLDFEPGAEKTVLLSHHIWSSAFGSSNDAVGRLVSINGAPHSVIGVLPDDFTFRLNKYDVATPSSFKEPRFFGAASPHVFLAGRLKEGVSEAQAKAEIKSFEARFSDIVPARYFEEDALTVKKLKERAHTLVKAQLGLLISTGAILFVIAAVNLCSIALVKLNQRRSEYAARVALGAGRWDIIRLFAIENGVIVLCGYVLAILFGYGLIQIVTTRFVGAQWGLMAMLGEEIYFNWRILGVTLLACIFVLVLISLTTLVLSSAGLLATFLKEESRGVTDSKAFKGLSSILRFLQISATCVAMIIGGFFMMSLHQISEYDYGYDFEGIVQTEVRLPYYRYTRPEVFDELVAMMDSIVAAARELPEVSEAAVGKLMFPHWGGLRGVRVADTPPELEERLLPQAKEGFVGPGFFELIGVAKLRGELFSHRHRRGAADRVMVVNEAFAHQYFKETDPLDQFVESRGRPHRIIGVVSNLRRWQRESGVRHGLPIDDEAEPAYYLPSVYDNGVTYGYLYLKTKDWNAGVEKRVRDAIGRVDADIVTRSFGKLRDRLDQRENTFTLIVFAQALLAGIGSLLACVAIYSTVSYSVSQRKREMGIRLALGATPRRIRRSILWYTSGLVAPAVAAGLVLAYVGLVYGNLLKNQIFLVDIGDPRVYLLSGAVLLTIGMLACLRPAFKAASLAPNKVLRET